MSRLGAGQDLVATAPEIDRRHCGIPTVDEAHSKARWLNMHDSRIHCRPPGLARHPKGAGLVVKKWQQKRERCSVQAPRQNQGKATMALAKLVTPGRLSVPLVGRSDQPASGVAAASCAS